MQMRLQRITVTHPQEKQLHPKMGLDSQRFSHILGSLISPIERMETYMQNIVIIFFHHRYACEWHPTPYETYHRE